MSTTPDGYALLDDLQRAAEALGLEVEPPNCNASSWTFRRRGPPTVGPSPVIRIEDFAHSLASFLRDERRQAAAVPADTCRGANWTPPAYGIRCFEAAIDEGSPEETCLHCGRHISLHFGGTEYRCRGNIDEQAERARSTYTCSKGCGRLRKKGLDVCGKCVRDPTPTTEGAGT